ncbi:serine/arginine repetitive matrix protein 2-like isoform X2 [Acanthaster planci]|uniref:Serine/arginine repetitive matrix protein 2-like isoform X2 n=1 Tax=Acanthaster planci TaxID=133434 RepID=A0A8B7ZHQ3_ACAPL|nr:serine/arginine repetitive matrix protein 2-like isoform X2 [Acanthaster planci]
MPRYSRSRSPRHRRRRSYSSSTSSRSRSRSRSPLRGNPKYRSHDKKTSRGRSHSRTPPRKDRVFGGGYKGSSSKQRGRRSRSYSPGKRRYGKAKSRSRSPSYRKERYRSPKRSPQRGGREPGHQQSEGGYQEGGGQLHPDSQARDTEGPQLPPGHNVFREEYGRGVQGQDQLPLTSRDVVYERGNSQSEGSQSKFTPTHPSERAYSKERYRENDKTKYEAVSPDDLRFTPKSSRRSESPYRDDRKISKPKPEYYKVQEKYSQPGISGQGYKAALPTESQNVKMAPPPIIRPIFDPYSVKIPRRKDEGLKEIFDRPELKARFTSEHLSSEGAPETRPGAAVEKKEPVVYRQDVHFTGTLPSGVLPPQAQGIIERREPLLSGFEPRRDTYPDPNLQYAPRGGPMGLSSQYPAQQTTFQVQPQDQFGPPKEVPPLQDFNRQSMFVQRAGSPVMGLPQSPVSYQYPPDDLPDIKGPHDLRHDLESRRKQIEQQQQELPPGRMRSLSRSRSRSRSRRISPSPRQRSRSRSRSHSPGQHYKSYHHRRSHSRERSQDHRSRDRRPVRERLGNMSKGSGDNSLSDGEGDSKSFSWTRKRTFYQQHDRRGDRSRSPDSSDSRERGSYRGTANRYRGSMRGTYRGGRGRGRGYVGKNYIPGYNRGMRGRYMPRGGRGSFNAGRRSPTWTHDLFDKEKEEPQDAQDKKDKKKQKIDKGKEKKVVKQKVKQVKKAKKVKKSPSRSETGQKNNDVPQALEPTETAS